jgi:hypothetical protein
VAPSRNSPLSARRNIPYAKGGSKTDLQPSIK